MVPAGAPVAPVSTHDNILSIKHHFRTADVLRVQRVHFRVHLNAPAGAPVAPVSTHDNILSIKHHFRTAGVLRVQRVHFSNH